MAVADDIAANAEALADLIDGFSDADFARTGIYSYPQTQERPLAWVAVHTVHEASTTCSTSGGCCGRRAAADRTDHLVEGPQDPLDISRPLS